MEQIRMTKDGAIKLVDREDIKEILEAEGWAVEGEESEEENKPRRGRKPREE